MADLKLARVPFKDAVEFLRNKVPLGTEAWSDLLHEAHDRAFVIAGVTRGDVLTDVQNSIAKALQDGTSFDQWKKKEFSKIIEGRWVPTDRRTREAAPPQAAGGPGEPNAGWRARVIFETNMRTAYAAGAHGEFQRMRDSHPYWQYRHGDSRVARPDHLSWDGMVLRADDPWWETHYPPNGFGCRCFVRPVSESAMRRMGKAGPDAPPPSPMRQVKYGDRMIDVPQGVDPGWAYTPGASLEDKKQVLDRQLERMRPDIAERVKKELASGAAGRTPDAEGHSKSIDEQLDEQERLAEKAKKAVEVKAKSDVEAKVREYGKLKMEAMRAYSEPVMKELLKETGLKFPNPIEFRDLGDDEAEYDPETQTITVSTRLMDKLRKAEKKGTMMETWDGGGFFVDRETLERVRVSPREYLKNTLAHELAHKKYLDHIPEFHELMYNHIVAGGSTYTDQLYVWSGTEGYARPTNRPDMVDEATWENMKKEKRMQERAAKRRARQ
jgi:SPP1 gp7 family putative phage head morphogenesis protein